MTKALTVVLILLMAFGMYHRIRSARTRESLDRKQEGWLLLLGIRLSGLASMVLTVFLLSRPGSFDWARVDLAEPVRWAGFGIVVAAALWLGWMFRTLGDNLTDTVVTRVKAHLVTAGPYRFVRNPMYVGVLSLTIGLGLAMGVWLVPLMGTVTFLLLAARTSIEERFLIARFGDAYREYMRHTGRFFPRLT